ETQRLHAWSWRGIWMGRMPSGSPLSDRDHWVAYPQLPWASGRFRAEHGPIRRLPLGAPSLLLSPVVTPVQSAAQGTCPAYFPPGRLAQDRELLPLALVLQHPTVHPFRRVLRLLSGCTHYVC